MTPDIYLTLVPEKTKDFLARCASSSGLKYDYEAQGVNVVGVTTAAGTDHTTISGLDLLNSQDNLRKPETYKVDGAAAYIIVINATRSGVRLVSAIDYANLDQQEAELLIQPRIAYDDKADGSRFTTSKSTAGTPVYVAGEYGAQPISCQYRGTRHSMAPTFMESEAIHFIMMRYWIGALTTMLAVP